MSAKISVLTHRRVSKIQDWMLLLLAGLIYLFLYAPIMILMFFSFNAADSTQIWGGFSLRWYKELLSDQSILDAFYTSLVVGITSTVIATVIGTLVAFALARNRFRGKSVADSTIYAATTVPDIVLGVSLLVFFVAVQFPLGLVTVIIAHVAFCISFVAIIVGARISGTDQTLEEAAQDLGATPVTTFLRVTLPLIMPGVMAGALIAFTLSFDDFVITFFVSGVGSTTLPLQIYSMIRLGVSPVVNALSTVVVVAVLILVLGGGRIFMGSKET